MDFVGAKAKRSRNRRKKWRVKKRRREQVKYEVKTANHRKLVSERPGVILAKDRLFASTMQADSFWKNYTVAQEWQKRHSVTWWRSRCFALEYENQILRDKIRSLACHSIQQSSSAAQKSKQYVEDNGDEQDQSEEAESNIENGDLEFHVDEDMMTFLEQSIRHKIELKKMKESESAEHEKNEEEIQGGAAWMRARKNNAKLLYGEASPTILAMETALQTTVDRHKDKAKPQYWPVVPLKP